MDIVLPHSLTYNISERPDAEEVAATIISNKIAIVEAAAILEKLVPGLVVTSCKVEVASITQNSPLKEAFLAAMIVSFQPKIGEDLPKVIEGVTGANVPEEYKSLISIIAFAIIFFGIKAAIDIVRSGANSVLSNRKYDELVSAISQKVGIEEDEVKKTFDNVIKGKKKKSVIKASLNLFKPAKRDPNSSIIAPGIEEIDQKLVSEVPDASMLDAIEPEEHFETLENVDVYLIAQDKQHKRQGWAGVLPSVGEARLKMAIMPPISPQDVFLKSSVKADITMVYRSQDDGSYKPYMFYLNRLRD